MDGLKQINDRFGHAEGSAAIVQTALIYRQAMRESGIIARIGGDEFVILAIGTTPAGDEVPARLKAKLDEYNAHSGRPYQLRVSIGIERVDPRSPASIEEMLARADQRMYEHKRGKPDSHAHVLPGLTPTD